MNGSSEIRGGSSEEIQEGSPFTHIIRNSEKRKPDPEPSASILIVEDDPFVSLLLEGALTKRNYHVCGIFSRGADALIGINALRPDLVIMDIMLDGEMDGIQVAKVISENYTIPVVYLTASEEETTADRARDTNHFAFIIKPFKPAALYTAIEVALFRTRMEKELRISQQRYATTLQNIEDAVISFDGLGNVNYINPSASTFLGLNEGKSEMRKISTLLRNIRDENGNSQQFKARLKDGNEKMLEGLASELYLFRENLRIPLELKVTFIHDEKGAFTGGVIVLHNLTRRKEEEIKWANVVVGAQETDRRKISENLHESLAQILTAISFNVSSLENHLQKTDDLDNRTFGTLKKLVDSAMEECRDISQHLSPRVLKDFGLAAAIEEMCMRISRNQGLSASLNAVNYLPIEKTREIIFFRIAQELIDNVIKHSGAEILKISLKTSSDKNFCILQITNDGQGFDSAKYFDAPINSGFKNIQNRIVLLGGKSYFRTSIRNGTTFQVVIPS